MGRMTMEQIRERVKEIACDHGLAYSQREHQLALLAEETMDDYVDWDKNTKEALEKGVICPFFQRHIPYRPRYLLPDYAKALRQGSQFLECTPPENLEETLFFLLTLYAYVPSISGFPVYIGNIDHLLDSYTTHLSDEELLRTLKLFWRTIDRLFPDAYVHANIGPEETRVGRMILQIERELQQVVPNLTLKYDPTVTPEPFLREAIQTVFAVAKPHIVNHPMMVKDVGEQYGVASCYNSLKVGGGAHDLIRINLKKTVELHQGNVEAYFEQTLPYYLGILLQVCRERVRFLVDESGFFTQHFLVNEGLCDLKNFSTMVGIFGVAEAVNLLESRSGSTAKYGQSTEANEMAFRLIEFISDYVAQFPLPHCEGYGGRAMLHAQSGIDLDVGVTPGARIPIGDEPELLEHLETVAPLHSRFSAGISDIFHFEDTVQQNPQAVVDIVKGAFERGLREFTFNLANGPFVRITGYLARRSDLINYEKNHSSRYGTTAFALGTVQHRRVLERKVRRIP